MISLDGYLDFARRRPGPAFKVYDTVNMGEGIVHHSMEGWFGGSMAELDKPERQASWMFSIDLAGQLWQHYPITASCWASGNGLANTHWWSIELEGLYSMPINDAQLATLRRLHSEWSLWKGKPITRTGDLYSKSMWEHREVDTLISPNAGDTSCPSERYARAWAELSQEDDMTKDEVKQLIADALAEFGNTDTDDRLRDVAAKRNRLLTLAVTPDVATVDAAIVALTAAGIIV